MEERAKELRAQGLTYREIGERLGVDPAKAWRLCNLEASRANQRDSEKRWRARGCTPLWQGEEA